MTQVGYRIEVERPQDSEIKKRRRGARVISTVVSSIVILTIPMVLIGWLGLLAGSVTTGCVVGFIIGGITLSIVGPKRMLVINPEWCGYVTQNIFDKGAMVAYGPGMNFSHWWEQRNADGNYSLKVQSKPFDIPVTTGSGKVIFAGQYEYVIDLSLLDLAIGVSQSVVEKGITAFIQNFLTVESADKMSKDVRSEEALKKLGGNLQRLMMDDTGMLANIRKKYGYKTVAVIIDKVTLPDDVQKTRDAIDEADALFEIVAKLHGVSKEDLKERVKKGGDISPADYQKMLLRAMAVSDNKTSIDVKVIEGLEGSPAGAVAATLDALKSGGKK
jgi:hypothetical protein